MASAPKTLVRARIDERGEVQHLLPPEYHGDPIKDEGRLCYYHFGWDLLDALREVGFTDVGGICYWSKRLGYLGDQMIFVARR